MKSLKDLYLLKQIENQDKKIHTLDCENQRLTDTGEKPEKVKANKIKQAALVKKVESLRKQLSKAAHVEALDKNEVLRLEHLTMQFGGLKAVDDLSFSVNKGDIFGLIGPNGAGKTTVFNCITQFYKPTKGTVLYKDRSGATLLLNDYKVQNVVSLGIVRTFQNVEVIGQLTVLENMLVGAHTQYGHGIPSHFFDTRAYRKEDQYLRARALKVLDYMGLSAIKDFYPVGLPYGTLKKIEMARTLMSNPQLIILDEPAAGLNDKETAELSLLIKKIQKDYNVTIFLVEHDMELVMGICNRICAISFGKMLGLGTPKEIQNNKAVREAYLGGDTNE